MLINLEIKNFIFYKIILFNHLVYKFILFKGLVKNLTFKLRHQKKRNFFKIKK